jgi:hypothetical protein
MIEFIQYNDSWYDATIEFLKREWKSINADKWDVYFRWKYLENPYVNSPPVFLAVEGDRVVGFRGIFIQKFYYGEREVFIGSGADVRVSENRRGKGIYRNLIEEGYDYSLKNTIQYLLNLSSNTKSTPILLKLGWKPIRGKRELIKLAANSFNPRYRSTSSTNRTYQYKNLQIKEYAGELTKSEEVIGQLVLSSTLKSHSHILSNSRDREFYRYKLANPVSNYVVYTFHMDKNIAGHIIVKLLAQKKIFNIPFHVFKIIDFIYGDNYEASIMNGFFKKVCIKSDIMMNSILSVPLLTMSNYYESIYKKYGFIKENRLTDKLTGRTSLPFLVKPTENSNNAWYIEGKSILDYTHWHLTGIDVDNA